jgi:predicted transcriptional regulator
MNVDISSNELEGRRDRLNIMAGILEATLEGALKTHVMFKANLSFAQLNQYLSLLLDLNLLELKESNERVVYKTATKGMRFLEGYKQIQELLKEQKFSLKKVTTKEMQANAYL